MQLVPCSPSSWLIHDARLLVSHTLRGSPLFDAIRLTLGWWCWDKQPPIADLLQNTLRGFQQRGPRTSSSSLLKNKAQLLSLSVALNWRGCWWASTSQRTYCTRLCLRCDAKQDYTHNASVCSLRKLQLEMEMIFVLNTAHISEWSIWDALILRQLARLRAMCCVTGSAHTPNLSPLSNDENWSWLRDPSKFHHWWCWFTFFSLASSMLSGKTFFWLQWMYMQENTEKEFCIVCHLM